MVNILPRANRWPIFDVLSCFRDIYKNDLFFKNSSKTFSNYKKRFLAKRVFESVKKQKSLFKALKNFAF